MCMFSNRIQSGLRDVACRSQYFHSIPCMYMYNVYVYVHVFVYFLYIYVCVYVLP